jgi:hypothetical protein
MSAIKSIRDVQVLEKDFITLITKLIMFYIEFCCPGLMAVVYN